MVFFQACYMAICGPRSSTSEGGDELSIINEHTRLTSASHKTVVHQPPPQRRGFSVGFDNYFETSQGVSLACLHVAIYYVLAVVAYSFVFEKWTVIDSVYFATVTFTTIGYGDLSPQTDGGRLFLVAFALYGIFILGFLAGMVGEKLVEMHTLSVQIIEESSRNEVRRMFGVAEKQVPEKQLPPKMGSAWSIVWRVFQLEFPLIVVILVIGAMYGCLIEGWTLIESIYYAVVTCSTVGYGDFSPHEPLARLCSVFALPMAVAVFCEVLGRIAGSYLDYKMEMQEEAFLNRQLTKADLDNMDVNKDGEVCWGEFLSFMLVAMQKVDENDVAQLREVFDRLDVTKTGFLDKNDLRIIVQQNAAAQETLAEQHPVV